MPDYDKIGREARAIFTAFPVEPETEEGKMVAELRYPGWREKGMPPLVPTPEAVERWGHLWWRNDEDEVTVASVFCHAKCTPGYVLFHADARPVVDDGFWLGPVLERPVREG